VCLQPFGQRVDRQPGVPSDAEIDGLVPPDGARVRIDVDDFGLVLDEVAGVRRIRVQATADRSTKSLSCRCSFAILLPKSPTNPSENG